MDRYLIINADDFGMCHAANTATFHLFELGGITSATIMTPCGWAPEALWFAKNHPEYAIGVHLTFTSEWGKYKWRPVSRGECASLRDEFGFMHMHCDGFDANANILDVEAEIRAQIAYAKQSGLVPSHLDNHMGSLYGLESQQNFLPLVFKLCAEMDLPFRMPSKAPDGMGNGELRQTINSVVGYADSLGVPILDYLWTHSWDGPQSDSYENFRDYMLERFHECPNGFVETFIHPSEETDELKNTSSVWKRRVWEYKLFGDPATRNHIEALGIQLIDYRDLKRMRKA